MLPYHKEPDIVKLATENIRNKPTRCVCLDRFLVLFIVSLLANI